MIGKRSWWAMGHPFFLPVLLSLLVAVCLIAAPSAYAQVNLDSLGSEPTPISGLAKVDPFFAVHTDVLNYDDLRGILMISMLVNRSGLAVEEAQKGGLHAMYEVVVQLKQGYTTLAEDFFRREDWSRSFERRNPNAQIPEIQKYGLGAGDYTLKVRIVDLIRGSYAEVSENVTIPDFGGDSLLVSDIVLCANPVTMDIRAPEFEHRGLSVVPHADRTWGEANPDLHYYFEIYRHSGVGESFELDRWVTSAGGDTVLVLDTNTYRAQAPVASQHGRLEVGGFEHGGYTLHVGVTDLSSGQYAESSADFKVFRPEQVYLANVILEEGTFGEDNMDEEALDRELRAIQYLVTGELKQMAQSLEDENLKRVFLSKFWESRDPDTTTAVNEFRQEYLARLEMANERFGNVPVPGWLKDRGRVLMLYGEPTYIEDHSGGGASSTHAYQIWSYDNVQGGVEFVFVDKNDLGVYTQVHSTARYELSNPGWEQEYLNKGRWLD